MVVRGAITSTGGALQIFPMHWMQAAAGPTSVQFVTGGNVRVRPDCLEARCAGRSDGDNGERGERELRATAGRDRKHEIQVFYTAGPGSAQMLLGTQQIVDVTPCSDPPSNRNISLSGHQQHDRKMLRSIKTLKHTLRVCRRFADLTMSLTPPSPLQIDSGDRAAHVSPSPELRYTYLSIAIR